VLYIFFLDWTGEVVGEKLAHYIDAILDQSPETIHSISFPFPFVVAPF
jgi:hypothetical protein